MVSKDLLYVLQCYVENPLLFFKSTLDNVDRNFKFTLHLRNVLAD